jgi:hypothetical protein
VAGHVLARFDGAILIFESIFCFPRNAEKMRRLRQIALMLTTVAILSACAGFDIPFPLDVPHCLGEVDFCADMSFPDCASEPEANQEPGNGRPCVEEGWIDTTRDL